MQMLEAIGERAKADLVFLNEDGAPDVLLWEHSFRVAATAKAVLRFPGVAALEANEVAVAAAAFYHDAGFIVRLRRKSILPDEILTGPGDEQHREAGVELMNASLSDLLDHATLELANQALRTLAVRVLHTPEAKVVSDAENLNKVGILSLWPMIRRGVRTGGAVGAVLEKWRRQQEYKFWQARINESFHFDSVRRLANARLEVLTGFMEELDHAHRVLDVAAAAKTRKGATEPRAKANRH